MIGLSNLSSCNFFTFFNIYIYTQGGYKKTSWDITCEGCESSKTVKDGFDGIFGSVRQSQHKWGRCPCKKDFNKEKESES